MTIFKKNWASKGKKLQQANIIASQPEMANSPRIISVAALKARLTVAERDGVRKATDEYMIDIWGDLIDRLYIHLDMDGVTQGLGYVLNYLTTVDNFQDPSVKTVIDPSARLVELLIDGTGTELYKDVL